MYYPRLSLLNRTIKILHYWPSENFEISFEEVFSMKYHERAYFLLIHMQSSINQNISRYHIQLSLSRINEFYIYMRNIETH